MTSPARAQPDRQESVDLAALGQTYAPPSADATTEVSDVLGAMPWWAARGLLYIVAGFVVAALLWAGLSTVDVAVEGRGALVPEGYVRPVQAEVGGVVQYVRAREGEVVERGQTLVQLDATELRTRLSKLREELVTTGEQLRRLRAARGLAAETLEQENRIARLESEIAGAELAFRQTAITAPVGGVITTLPVRGAGAVVQVGQAIATIAPGGARLVVEVQIPNKDIAFVEQGLPVKLKFDAFPFQDYGTVPGTVIEVSPDAQFDQQLGSSYKVTIAPGQTTVKAKDKDVALRPGLALTAEIITERKSVLSLLLEPLRK